MEIVLLGKKLDDYPETENRERFLKDKYDFCFKDSHNVRVFRRRINDNFKKGVKEWCVMDGNYLYTTKEIIAWCRVILSLNILTDEEWNKAIPIIEHGLEANKAYVRMLDEMSPIFERYCEEWEDVLMRNTFMERIHLECWQGRFSQHQLNPNQEPNYC